MEDKLEVGMYVRTKQGNIEKICAIVNGHIYTDDDYLEWYPNSLFIKKPSHKIIGLIEVGDYVNGHRVTCVMESLLGFEDGQDGDWYMENKDIKSILTHEQFDRMVYRIEE